MVTPSKRRIAVTEARQAAQLSERRACRFTGFCLSTQRYHSRRPSEGDLRQRLRELAEKRPRWGYRRLYVLLKREGCKRNRKLVQRLYREEGLSVRRRKRRKMAAVARSPMKCPLGPNERWSIDFVRDTLADGAGCSAALPSSMISRESARPSKWITRFRESGWLALSTGSLENAVFPRQSFVTTGRNSKGKCSTSGPIGRVSPSPSFNPGNRFRMPSSRASTENFETSA